MLILQEISENDFSEPHLQIKTLSLLFLSKIYLDANDNIKVHKHIFMQLKNLYNASNKSSYKTLQCKGMLN